MEKKKIQFSYASSGVNTLSGFGAFFIIIGFISLIVGIIGLIWYLSEIDSRGGSDVGTALALMSNSIYIALASFISGAICRGLSTIARTSLYQRYVLETEYEFDSSTQSPVISGSSPIPVNTVVINKYTGDKLIVTKITEDGKCQCVDFTTKEDKGAFKPSLLGIFQGSTI